jgi:dihydroorotase
MRFDLLIKGGKVVDPGGGHQGLLDVAVKHGRIAAVDRDIPEENAFSVLDATGQLVLPGLVDFHAHVFHDFTYWGLNPSPIASRTGVTTWNDAGSAGAVTIQGFRRHAVEAADVRVTCFMNISMIGLVAENYEGANLALCATDLFRRVVDLNRDLVVGVKTRMGSPTVGDTGVEALRLAVQAGEECDLPVMVHIAMGPPPIDDVLDLLRPGDIVTHCFTGQSMKIIGPDDRIRDAARRAIERGVLLDIGHGAGSFSFETAEALCSQGYLPDTISTDIHQLSVNGPMFDLPTTMSKFLALGLPLADVVRATTARPAELLGLSSEVGTFRPAARADIALFQLLEGEFPLYDIAGNVRVSRHLLRNTLTLVGGRILARREPDPPAPWVDPIWPSAQIVFTEKQRRLHELGHTPDALAASTLAKTSKAPLT